MEKEFALRHHRMQLDAKRFELKERKRTLEQEMRKLKNNILSVEEDISGLDAVIDLFNKEIGDNEEILSVSNGLICSVSDAHDTNPNV